MKTTFKEVQISEMEPDISLEEALKSLTGHQSPPPEKLFENIWANINTAAEN